MKTIPRIQSRTIAKKLPVISPDDDVAQDEKEGTIKPKVSVVLRSKKSSHVQLKSNQPQNGNPMPSQELNPQ